jgi:hypothetical protein
MSTLSSEFFINLKKYISLSNQGLDFFIKSWRYNGKSIEKQILLLKQKLYDKEAKRYLLRMIKYLDKLNE